MYHAGVILVPFALLVASPLGPRKMPEPLIGESVTDLDGTEAGELEVDATGLVHPPDGFWSSGVEVEWRALPRLGISLEGATSREAASANLVTAGLSALGVVRAVSRP